VLPSNLDCGAPRVKAFDPEPAVEAQQDVVNLLEEAQEMTLVCLAHYQQTFASTKRGRSGEESSKLTTWYYGERSRRRTSTSSLHLEKDHIPSRRWFCQEPTDFRTATATSSPKLGTLSSFVVSSPKFSSFACFHTNADSYNAPAQALLDQVAREHHGGTLPRALLPHLSFCKPHTKRQLFSPERMRNPFPQHNLSDFCWAT
jgi:hypothetical protein